MAHKHIDHHQPKAAHHPLEDDMSIDAVRLRVHGDKPSVRDILTYDVQRFGRKTARGRRAEQLLARMKED